MIDKSELSSRMMSGVWLALAVALMISVPFVVDSHKFDLTKYVIAISSPVMWWRMTSCYRDPLWLQHIESVLPFFFYGLLIGSYLNIRPKFKLKYFSVVLSVFIFVAVIEAALAFLFIGHIDRVAISNCGN